MATVCIICKENKKGINVKDDFVISSIRSVKRALRIATNNMLVVCKDCLDEHKNRRKNYERKLLTYAVLGGVLGLALILLSRSLQGIVLSILFVLFMIALSIFHYHPATVST